MRVAFAAIAAFCVLLSGCAGGPPDFQVRIDSEFQVEGKGRQFSFGHGVLIDSRHVITVAHVAPEASRVYHVSRAAAHMPHAGKVRYIKAKWLGVFAKGRSIEGLIVLRLSTPMVCDAFPEVRGVEPGDSGSPILGKRGAVIGLVTGWTQNMFFPGRTLLGTNAPLRPVPYRKED